MAEHNEFLEATKEEVAKIRKRQRKAQEEMDKVEKEMMERWTKEKAAGKIPMDKVEALLNGAFSPPSHNQCSPAVSAI